MMRDFAEIFGDEPDIFLGGHPTERIEPRQIHRPGKSPEGSFTAQVEINVEVAQGEFAERAVNRFAITTAGKV